MKNYPTEQAWFKMPGLPYPIRGYYNPNVDATPYVVPGFERAEAEVIVDIINRTHDSPDPALEWSVDGDIIATEEGRECEYFDIPRNNTKTEIPLYWMGHGWGWEIVYPTDESMWHLEFKTVEKPPILAYGSGSTLIQALADLELDLMMQAGVNAAFHNHCCFLNRDITTIGEDLSMIGGKFSCHDFSSWETAFEISRIPLNPKADKTPVTGDAAEPPLIIAP